MHHLSRSFRDEWKDFHCPCLERFGVCRCVLALCVFITFHSWLGTCFNDSYLPDGTSGNDNLWAIESNYISRVCTQKKARIINNELRVGGPLTQQMWPSATARRAIACLCFIDNSHPLAAHCGSMTKPSELETDKALFVKTHPFCMY